MFFCLTRSVQFFQNLYFYRSNVFIILYKKKLKFKIPFFLNNFEKPLSKIKKCIFYFLEHSYLLITNITIYYDLHAILNYTCI